MLPLLGWDNVREIFLVAWVLEAPTGLLKGRVFSACNNAIPHLLAIRDNRILRMSLDQHVT